MRNWLFIADLHLAAERPQMIKLFERFVNEIAIHAERLYILGDFLEYWLGDDDRATGLDEVFSTLKKLNNTDVFFMHGNRDFLVGETLAKRCGFNLIYEPLVEEINGKPVLLMHGDALCTDDVEYQQFRAMVRDATWQAELLSKPLEEREQIARALREKSRQATAEKAEEIMDVNPRAVIETMQQYAVSTLIHGHTHRPAIHDFEINGSPARRIVLGDWYETGSYLKISANEEPELITFG